MSSFSKNTKQSDISLGTFILISNGSGFTCSDNGDLSEQVANLQIDFSDCYEEMAGYLVETGRFVVTKGLTREGFTLESTNEHGERDGHVSKYSLDHYSYHDEKWEQYYQNLLQLENQAKAIGIELMFHNHVTVHDALKLYTDSVAELYIESNEEEALSADVPIGNKRKSKEHESSTCKKRKFTLQVEHTVLGSYTIEAYSIDEAKQFSLNDLQDKHEYQFIWESSNQLTGNVEEV